MNGLYGNCSQSEALVIDDLTRLHYKLNELKKSMAFIGELDNICEVYSMITSVSAAVKKRDIERINTILDECRREISNIESI